MKCLVLFVPLLLAIGCSKSTYDGHGDGEMSVGVEVVVSDSLSGDPIDAVSVTFFSRQDEMSLQLIDAMRERGQQSSPTKPVGLTVTTDPKGRAKLSCRFDAAFLFRDRPGNVVRSEWRPGGVLRIEKAGFRSVTLRLADEFSSPPYVGDAASHSVAIKMEKEAQPVRSDNAG